MALNGDERAEVALLSDTIIAKVLGQNRAAEYRYFLEAYNLVWLVRVLFYPAGIVYTLFPFILFKYLSWAVFVVIELLGVIAIALFYWSFIDLANLGELVFNFDYAYWVFNVIVYVISVVDMLNYDSFNWLAVFPVSLITLWLPLFEATPDLPRHISGKAFASVLVIFLAVVVLFPIGIFVTDDGEFHPRTIVLGEIQGRELSFTTLSSLWTATANISFFAIRLIYLNIRYPEYSAVRHDRVLRRQPWDLRSQAEVATQT